MSDISGSLNQYISFYEMLTPSSLKNISDVVDLEIHFTDPFNDFQGITLFSKIFDDMFKHVREPKFFIHDKAISAESNAAFLKWTFTGYFSEKKFSFQGMSEVYFNTQGKVIRHIDYWDSGNNVFSRIPIVGYFIRMIQSKLKVKL